MNFLLKNKLNCHYCNAFISKQELTTYYNCKCLYCVNCIDNIKQQLFINYAYEYYINQYFDHIIVNNYAICPLCCSDTNYFKFTKVLHNSTVKQTLKYEQLY